MLTSYGINNMNEFLLKFKFAQIKKSPEFNRLMALIKEHIENSTSAPKLIKLEEVWLF